MRNRILLGVLALMVALISGACRTYTDGNGVIWACETFDGQEYCAPTDMRVD